MTKHERIERELTQQNERVLPVTLKNMPQYKWREIHAQAVLEGITVAQYIINLHDDRRA